MLKLNIINILYYNKYFILKKEDTLLHIACEAGDEGMVTLLIENGIDLDTSNKKGLTPLHVAARHGHINVVRHLCLAGCDVDKTNRGIRADVTAIKYGYPDIANLLDKLRIVSFFFFIDSIYIKLL